MNKHIISFQMPLLNLGQVHYIIYNAFYCITRTMVEVINYKHYMLIRKHKANKTKAIIMKVHIMILKIYKKNINCYSLIIDKIMLMFIVN